jgi:hypothetical protein
MIGELEIKEMMGCRGGDHDLTLFRHGPVRSYGNASINALLREVKVSMIAMTKLKSCTNVAVNPCRFIQWSSALSPRAVE